MAVRVRRWIGALLAFALPLLVATAATTTVSLMPAVAAEPPTITLVSPGLGRTAGGSVVHLTGTGLSGVTQVRFGAKAGARLAVLSDTELSVISPSGRGTVHLTAISPTGASAMSEDAVFRYVPSPKLTRLSATKGSTNGGATVTITGSDFVDVTQVLFGSTPGVDVQVVSESSLTVTTPKHSAGRVDVRVVTAYGKSGKSSRDRFTYVAPPRITKVSPAAGALGGGGKVTVFGTGFTKISRVLFGVTAGTQVRVASSRKLTVRAPAGDPGTVSVTAVGAYGASVAASKARFNYVAPPTIASLSPTHGSVKGGTRVTITGTDFASVSKVLFGSKKASRLKVKNTSSLTVVAPAQSMRMVDVKVITTYGTSPATANARYTYGSPPPTAPTIASVDPATGTAAGGTSVRITGTNLAGTSTITFGGANATNVTVDSATQVTLTTPAHAAGAVDVVLTASGGTVTKTEGYTYQAEVTPGSVSGRVTVGGVASQAVVTLDPGTPSDALFVQTGPDGTFSFLDVPPGEYEACANVGELNGCYGSSDTQTSSTLSIDAGASITDANIEIEGSGGLEGTVRTTSGSGVTNVSVTATSPDDVQSTSTDANGAYELNSLNGGSYQVCIAATAGSNLQVRSKCVEGVVVSRGQTATLDFQVEEEPSIHGVVSESDGTPAADVQVEIRGSSASYFTNSGPDGGYRVNAVESGSYSICFFPSATEGLVAQCADGAPGDTGNPSTNAVVVSDGAVEFNQSLLKAGGISGRVTGGSDAALAGVEVQVSQVSGAAVSATAVTSDDGTYLVTGLPPADYSVCFQADSSASEYLPACYNSRSGNGDDFDAVTVETGKTSTGIDQRLVGSGEIQGKVTNSNGDAVPGVWVEAVAEDGSTVYAVADDQGSFRLAGLSAQQYSICAYSDGVAAEASGCYRDGNGEGSVDVAAGQVVKDVNIVLELGALISGTVTDETDQPIAGVEVDVLPADDVASAAIVTTGSDGTYLAKGLSPGSYFICYEAEGFMAQCYDGVPPDGSVSLTEVTLDAGSHNDISVRLAR